MLDMYEHAFQMDYGAAAARYIEAYWKNVNWEVVERRFLHPAGQQGESGMAVSAPRSHRPPGLVTFAEGLER